MYKIQTLNKISHIGLDNFNVTKYNYGDTVENPDAIIVRSASMHDLAMSDNLKAIARAGAGVNNIPVEACTDKGIVVFNTPGANANAVKEMVLCGMLMSSRKINQSIDWIKTIKGNGSETPKLIEKGKSQFTGPEIKGKKLGVIGLGAIGVLVANMAVDLGLTVYGFDPYISIDGAWNLSSAVKHVKTKSEIFSECDFISVHVPLNDETKDMINSESIATMKKGIRILNFSRGALVNSADMIEAVNSGAVACYVTDFPSDDLIGVEGILAIPHLGASTPESEENCAQMAAIQLIDFLENGNIKNSVNLPNISSPKNTDFRIGVIHKNIPNMLTNISGYFSKAGINIDTMLNKSKKEIAYTLLDVVSAPDKAILDQINALDGVIRVFVF